MSSSDEEEELVANIFAASISACRELGRDGTERRSASPLSFARPFNSPVLTVVLPRGESSGSDGLVCGRGLDVRVGDTEGRGSGGTAGVLSPRDGIEAELVVGILCAGAGDFLVKLRGSTYPSASASTSDCGCDGELDLCETKSIVDAGEGGARESDSFRGALSNSRGFNDVGVLSLSLLLILFRLYHLSFPIPLLFGEVGSTKVLAGVFGVTSGLLCNWGNETFPGDGKLPEADELVETIETASDRGFLSPVGFLILIEGTCRNEWNSPPCDFWGGCWGIGGGGGKSCGRLGFE